MYTATTPLFPVEHERREKKRTEPTKKQRNLLETDLLLKKQFLWSPLLCTSSFIPFADLIGGTQEANKHLAPGQTAMSVVASTPLPRRDADKRSSRKKARERRPLWGWCSTGTLCDSPFDSPFGRLVWLCGESYLSRDREVSANHVDRVCSSRDRHDISRVLRYVTLTSIKQFNKKRYGSSAPISDASYVRAVVRHESLLSLHTVTARGFRCVCVCV